MNNFRTLNGWCKNHPAANRYRKYIMYHHPMEWFIFHNSFDRILRGSGWNETEILSGLERFDEICHDDQVFPYYSEGEMKQASSKRDAVVMRFSASAKTPAIVICSGGAYNNVGNMTEGFPVAAYLNSLGWNAFVVNYRVGKNITMPAPVDDLAAAIKYILDNSDRWNIDKKYILCGFSAGGNLVNTYCSDNLGYQKYGLPAPDCLWSVYAAVNDFFEEKRTAANGYLRARFGRNFSDDLLREYDVTEHCKNHPPAFITACKDDPVVSYKQSELLSARLTENGIRNELYLGEKGGHGFGLGKQTEVSDWVERALKFYQERE